MTLTPTSGGRSLELSAMQRMPLLEQLAAAGLLTDVQLELARREALRNGGKPAQIVVQLGFVAPEALADFLGRKAGSKAVNLNRMPIDQTLLALVPLEVARRCLSMPVSRTNGTLTVALADPFDVTAVDILHQVTGLVIDVVTAPERDILNCLELYYSTGDTISESIDKILDEKARQSAKPLEEMQIGRAS